MSEFKPTDPIPITDAPGTIATASSAPPPKGGFKSDLDIILARNETQNAEALLQTVLTKDNSEALENQSGANGIGSANRRKGNKASDDHKRKSNWQEGNRLDAKSAKTLESGSASTPKEKRLPKRKVAVLLGYYGKGYKGSQFNPGMKTIEGEVFKAFVKAGCISGDNSALPQKVGLQRAARTDANVHAGCNLISLKLILDPPSLLGSSYVSTNALVGAPNNNHSLALINHINSFLPDEIRLWSFVRVQNSFHARTMCDSRTYEYSLPTYLFLPPKPETALYKRLDSIPMGLDGRRWSECFESDELEGAWWKSDASHALESSPPADLDAGPQAKSNFKLSMMRKKSAYRISAPMLQRIKHSVDKFKGTHNFHNFTVGKEFKERNSVRIMREMSVSDPFIVGASEGEPGTEWISVKFHGQSFMLHQIRKMVGLIILLCRTRTPSNLIPELYGPVKVKIPKAPGLGLILQNPHFDGYNKRVLEANRSIQKQKRNHMTAPETNEGSDLIRETIDPAGSSEVIKKFKKEVLYKKIWEEEQKEDAFGVWINYIDVCNDPDLDFLNLKGVLPPSITNPHHNTKAERPAWPKTSETQTLAEKMTDSDEEVIQYQDGEGLEEG